MDWHSMQTDEVFKELKTESFGLDDKEVEKRQAEYGKNNIILGKKISPWKILFDQFNQLLVWILIGAALISYFVSITEGTAHYIDTILILGIVILNSVFGFFQDYKAEKSIEELKKLSSPFAFVIRNGIQIRIKSEELVPGDMIVLEEGQQIAADIRLIEENEIKVDEASLTGESAPVSKNINILQSNTQLADRKNMLYSGTTVVSGRGKGIVVATAMQTEIGKIASELEKTEDSKTVFEQEINELGKNIWYIILGIVMVVFLVQLLIVKTELITTFLTAISLAVAAVPEGLPAVVTLTLALGTKKMLKEKTLVRKLSVIESLGSVDVICTDKTGTLTEGRMSVQELYYDNKFFRVSGVGYEEEGEFFLNKNKIDPAQLEPLLKIGILCNDASIGKTDDKLGYLGDPTEIALIVSGKKAKIDTSMYERTDEIPFTSERKMMSTINKKRDKSFVFTKGAPEVVLDACDKILIGNKELKLTREMKNQILKANLEMTEKALRVLAFAYKEYDNKSEIEKNLVFVGLQGMIDAPRKEVKNSIKVCNDAGIRIIMITGDNKATAVAVGKEIGIMGEALEGKDIDNMDDKKFKEIVKTTSIFARVSPSHKLKILKALQENQHIVAMTGDGVNDAPALKGADVGISMGIKGTDVAKQASDMVLLDDNFKTIEKAVEQGRTIFNNIRKFVQYLLTSNLAEVLIVFLTSLFGYLSLTAAQLLWINFLTDGMPALALGTDPSPSDIMKRKPQKRNEKILSKKIFSFVGTIGIEKTIVLLAIFFIGMNYWSFAVAQTMLFTAFVVYEFVVLAVIRQNEDLTWKSNKWVLIAVISSILLQLIVIYSPLGNYFNVVGLGMMQWLVILCGMVVSYISATILGKMIETRFAE